jgi:hypothetical protein
MNQRSVAMRVEKLKDREAAWLRAMDFTVDAEGEGARLTYGDLIVTVLRPYKEDEFSVFIELPNGSELVCTTSAGRLMRAANDAIDPWEADHA